MDHAASGRIQAQPAIRASRLAPNVVGLVDNATNERLYGWAFDAARPGHRVTVELRLAGERLSRTIADLARPDLAQNGVGDGCHAFEFAVANDAIARGADFSVVAIAASGQEIPLPIRIVQHQPRAVLPKPDELASHVQLIIEVRRLRDVVSALGQRLATLPEATAVPDLLGQNASLMEQVRAGVQTLDERLSMLPGGDLVWKMAQQQSLLAERLQALEVWMDRLDRRLAETLEPTLIAPPRQVNAWQVILFSALGITLVGAVTVGLFLKLV